jgi:hypothetical protein
MGKRARARAAGDGPGAFITSEVLADVMTEQKAPIIGGARDYGREYDGYFQDRKWAIKSRVPTFSPITSAEAAKTVVESAASNVAKVIVGRARANLARQAGAAGLGGANRQFLTPSDIEAAPFGRMGGLGADPAAEPPFDLMVAVKDMYGTMTSVKPLLSFIGEHPVGTIALLLLVIGAGAAIGGFIGAGGVDAVKGK